MLLLFLLVRDGWWFNMAGTIVCNTLNTDTGAYSTVNAYNGIAKAWVRFSVSGTTPTVLKSFNISSVTYVTTGIFSFALVSGAVSDTSYLAVATSSINTSSTYFMASFCYAQASSPYYTAPTSSFTMGYITLGTSAFDNPLNSCVTVFD